jgi:hypothetical protein
MFIKKQRMSIDAPEKDKEQNKEKKLKCAVCKREFPSMPLYYEHIPCARD